MCRLTAIQPDSVLPATSYCEIVSGVTTSIAFSKTTCHSVILGSSTSCGWFHSNVGDDNVLMPNRFERSEEHRYKKCYLDGDLALRVTEPFQDTNESPELKYTVLGRPLRMIRPLNPHSGCFFLNTAERKHWAEQPYFENQEAGFVGPLESAATLGIMKTFRIYKPARENASFLEIKHHAVASST